MMKRLAHRMEHEGTWDQTAYNEEQACGQAKPVPTTSPRNHHHWWPPYIEAQFYPSPLLHHTCPIWQFYPSHGTHASVGVSSRVMNYLCNLNSKVRA